ncbi:membrane-associated progesterone receptor component 2-like [Clytia hemisphaerica]|uniref:membrane-associated progesterone receptor component 2-like n=1 Tax=Clytia hemisphaerica TaxID=252671 RepID=UPI0034D5C6A2|eukprot:TCONS_00029278-protein
MSSLFSAFSNYLTPPVQVVLLCLTVIAIRAFMVRRRREDEVEEETRQTLPDMEKRDFTLEELKPYNGVDDPRILIAVNGKVFDVSRGHNNYGPDGPYHVFAGRDASRGLGTFSIDASTFKDGYDDLSDLNSMQMDSVLEWEMQFQEKYVHIGRLLKPGEKHCNYKAEESEDESRGGTPNKKED